MRQNEMFLLKLGEVVLKGQNRRSFEDRLVANTARRLKSCGSFQVYIRQSTIYAEPVNESCDMEAAYAAARQVFGVVSVARAVPCEKTVEAIVETAKANGLRPFPYLKFLLENLSRGVPAEACLPWDDPVQALCK